jgi:Tol biopolymer transport system component
VTLGDAVNFQGTASDTDGSVASHNWNFGDGGGATVEDPGAHTYVSVGTYTVTYTVTDDQGASSTPDTEVVTVEPASIGSLSGRILFSDNRVGAVDQWEVFSMAPDGSDHRQITSELSNYQMHPVASPDGRILVYERWDQNPLTGSLANVKVARADGTNAAELRGGSERSPSFSPDGTRIALVTSDALILTNPDGTNQIEVRQWFVSARYNKPILSPQAWWPTGEYIFFSQQPNYGMGEPQQVFYFSFVDSSTRLRVGPPSEHPSISVNGWMAFSSDFEGHHDIYLLDLTVSNSSSIRLTTNPSADRQPVWSPDGSKVLFVSDRDGNNEIYVVNRDGTGLTNLTGHPASQTDPYWVP